MSWPGWSISPSLAYVVLAALLYWLGGRRQKLHPQPLRALAFAGGLVTILVALQSPIDGYADRLFWAHMIQHVLLLTVAPPLILLGRPWPRMWRALPSSLRVRVGRTLARSDAAAPLRAVVRPLPAFLLFNGTIIAWHIPGAYDATLASAVVHQIEHAMFFFTGILFWAHMIDPGPLRPRLTWPVRIGYVVGAMVIGWVIAIVLVMTPDPLYSHYALLSHRPGGISAATDQQLAGGIMWVPGSLAYSLAAFIGFYRWLEPDAGGAPSRSALLT